MRLSPLLLAFVLVIPVAAQTPAPATTVAGNKEFQALLTTHCASCHGAQKQEGQLHLARLDPDIVKGADAEHWQEVLDRLNAGTMPPKGKSKLTPQERDQLTVWLTSQLKLAADARRSTGGHTVLRRLTRYEYNHTLRDLLGIDDDFAKDLPPESAAELGFQNNSTVLTTSLLHVDYFRTIAKQAVLKALGPKDQPTPYTLTLEPGKGAQTLPPTLAANRTVEFKLEPLPTSGPVLIRVTAWATRTPKGDYPHLQIELVREAGRPTKPSVTVAELGIDAKADKPQAYVISYWAERFPMNGGPANVLRLRSQFDVGTGDLTEADFPVVHLKKVEVIAPYYQTWPPETRTRLLPESKHKADEKVYVREVLTKFLPRAYRRPATEPEITRMVDLFLKLRPAASSFDEALADTLSAVLLSPNFLLLAEPARTSKAAATSRPLRSHEMAARLSYFLWSTMPDDTLFALAEQDKLQDAEVLRAQVQRMLDDPKSQQFSQRFVTQWLELESLDRVAINPEYFPNFKDELKPVLKQETVQFFATLLREDLSCLNLLDSDFAVLNADMARLYGVHGVAGDAFRKVPVKPYDHRGGILTHASILAGNSSGDDTHPVKRGVWVLERLLNDPPPPPPPEVPTLAQNNKNGDRLSLADKLQKHRSDAACLNCHRKIDPWGLAFENYNAIGMWRESRLPSSTTVTAKKKKKGPAMVLEVAVSGVDAKTELPDGTKINGMVDLKKYLLTTQRDRFTETLVSKLLSYALWRNLEFSDRDAVQTLNRAFRAGGYQLRPLLTDIVLSESFRTK